MIKDKIDMERQTYTDKNGVTWVRLSSSVFPDIENTINPSGPENPVLVKEQQGITIKVIYNEPTPSQKEKIKEINIILSQDIK